MELSETQAKVLEILQLQPRLSMRELSDRIGVSPPTAGRMVEELEDLGVIKGYRAELDSTRLNLHTFLVTIMVEFPLQDSIAASLSEHERIGYIAESDDGRLFIRAVVPSLREFDGILEIIKSTEGVKRVGISRIICEHKDQTILSTEHLTKLEIQCFHCKKYMKDTPVKVELDGKKHYVCCDVCASEYRERYRSLVEGSK